MIIRILDILFSFSALAVLLPILVPVAVILRLTGEGHIFYVQERVGKNATKFGLVKFATMLEDSPNMKGGTITVENDPRVLPVGRVLRKTKINELPQLANILVGDMSVIGPRPLTENHYRMYPVKFRETISSVKPGLSGIGSIIFRDEERFLSVQQNPAHYYENEIAPYKAALEVWFVENKGITLYLKCIFITAWAVFRPNSTFASKLFPGIPLPVGKLQNDLKVGVR